MPTMSILRGSIEWGPAMHDPENPFSHEATQAVLAERAVEGDRPDDN